MTTPHSPVTGTSTDAYDPSGKMRLIQVTHRDRGRRVALVDELQLALLHGPNSIFELAAAAVEKWIALPPRRVRELAPCDSAMTRFTSAREDLAPTGRRVAKRNS
ncbi:MAG: hypothetical protein AAF961_16690, partial [Planctomycetota bacterium]